MIVYVHCRIYIKTLMGSGLSLESPSLKIILISLRPP